MDARELRVDARVEVLLQLRPEAQHEHHLKVDKERRQEDRYREPIREYRAERNATNERTLHQVVEERRGAALGGEVTDELGDPGKDMNDAGDDEAVLLVGERVGGEETEHQLRDKQQLRAETVSCLCTDEL